MAFRLDPAFGAECQMAARRLEVPFVEVRHLEAACRALGRNAGGLMFAGAIKPWDREILVQHAARARVQVHFIEEEEDVASATRVLSTWRAKTRGVPSGTGPRG